MMSLSMGPSLSMMSLSMGPSPSMMSGPLIWQIPTDYPRQRRPCRTTVADQQPLYTSAHGHRHNYSPILIAKLTALEPSASPRPRATLPG